jgi:hypothetical protein
MPDLNGISQLEFFVHPDREQPNLDAGAYAG